MADDIEEEEVFDEEDLADGFDAEALDGDELGEDAINIADVDADPEIEGDDADLVEDVDVADEEDEVVVEVETPAADDEDDLALDHDVELALDEVLAETMRLTTEPEDDDDSPVEVEDKTDPTDSVLPKQDDEFRCRSCRLLKKMSQLADRDRTLCRDCV
jgi:hypothetical protein